MWLLAAPSPQHLQFINIMLTHNIALIWHEKYSVKIATVKTKLKVYTYESTLEKYQKENYFLKRI
jgi:hypothetical protein